MKIINRILRLGAACLILAFSSACAHYSVDDKPLTQWTPELRSTAEERVAGDRSSELLILVAFSGGGTRAASFAYGVLQELADTEVMAAEGARPLLKEIDMISSVSGGSFTSSYYGLYGDRIFEDFEERFLRKNVQGDLMWKLFNPINWFRLLSTTYGKADMAAKYYDKILYNDATFADLHRPGAPVVVINSTDLGTGIRFPFIMPYFVLICADLKQYPVSRAVTASSAVPGLFSTITLENFAGSCGVEPPAWWAEALEDDESTFRKIEALDLKGYLDREKRPWLHLVDGGVSDNLGLRSLYKMFVLTGDPQYAIKALHHEDVRQILLISVDSHKKADTEWASKRRNPSLMQMLGSITAVEIGRYSLATIETVRDSFEDWTTELSTTGPPVSFHFVEVSFNQVKNDDERNRLNEIGTNFNLNDDEVDLLISSARKVVLQSPALQAFLAENRQQRRP
jgi:NTE family protein